ncbi:MAG: hypothetical protein HeimC3_52510 [Candidatus Heimdallarchaeota archaeon LC_3]|nr:MAG: hypothetical protein HeimC3_52510 [Candidatus Heimdallarchaeota archaeon LC_3]
MEYKNRLQVFNVPSTNISNLRAFEKRLFNLKIVTIYQLIIFLLKEKAELMHSPEFIMPIAIIELLKNGTTNSFKYIGEPNGCDFQFRKRARRSINTSLYPQRFHGRVYIYYPERQIVIVSENETDPTSISTGLFHLNEKYHHRIIRLKLKINLNVPIAMRSIKTKI